jgi:hypothetical protein
MDFGGKACNNIPEAVDKPALSARLDLSCETVWNKHDSSYYSKQNSVLLQGKMLALSTTSIWSMNIYRELTDIKEGIVLLFMILFKFNMCDLMLTPTFICINKMKCELILTYDTPAYMFNVH